MNHHKIKEMTMCVNRSSMNLVKPVYEARRGTTVIIRKSSLMVVVTITRSYMKKYVTQKELINVCGLNSKLLSPEFISLTQHHDIIGLQETTTDDTDTSIVISGYQIYFIIDVVSQGTEPAELRYLLYYKALH